MGAKLAENCQTVVPLYGAEGILEVQAGNDVVWVLLEPGSDRHGHCKSPLGGANAVLSVFQVNIKVRPGLGEEKVAQQLGPQHADEDGSDPAIAFVQANELVEVDQSFPSSVGADGAGLAGDPLQYALLGPRVI